MAYKLLTLCCVLLVQSRCIQTRQETAYDDRNNSIEKGPASDDGSFFFHNVKHSDNLSVGPPGLLRTPWWSTFIRNIIQYFHQQREHNRSQFGCLFMGNVVNFNQFDPNFFPQVNGRPVIDNSNPISPPNINNFGNYVASRPENVFGTMVHSEILLLNQLDNLWNAYLRRYNQRPNFILLYSWIMPCQDCTDDIINHLGQYPFRNVPNRVIAYTVEGTNFLPYMTDEDNQISRDRLRQNGMFVWRERCQRPNSTTTQGTNVQGQELSFQIMDKKTKLDGTVFIEKQGPVGDDPDTRTCQLNDAFQGCLFACLDTNLCCSCKESNKPAMKAAIINELTLTCATSEFGKCAKSWIDKNIGNASGCIRQDAIKVQMEYCASQCYDKPLSNPLDPYRPLFYPEFLTNFSKLAEFQRPNLSIFCRDIRTEDFLCAQYTADSFTAGNTLCRSDNKCGLHQGTPYSWCYTDYSNTWDYCCTGSCGFGEGTLYLWCPSGNKWQYCGGGGSVDIQGRQCLSSFPCGMHQEVGKAAYYWCYVDLKKNWDRCCQPQDMCSKKGQSYYWCWTGYKTKTDWQYCKP